MADPGIVARLLAGGCVFAQAEAALLTAAARDRAELAAMVAGRLAGAPLEHVLGWAEFCGLRIAVDAGVFVPRRRTGFLVEQAAVLAKGRADLIVADLCCGSGALGVALAARVRLGGLHAVDSDPAAARCAARNLTAAGGHAYLGDLYEPLPSAVRGRVGILLANVPYVPTADIAFLPAEARLHEARAALDGGTDGLDVLRRVVAGAPGWLAPGGHLLTEVSQRQAPAAMASFAEHGLGPRLACSDELEATVVIGTRLS